MKSPILALMLLLAACGTGGAGPLVVVAPPQLTDQAMVAADGAVLPLRRWLPPSAPSAVIAALHGFNDYRAAFDLPGPHLAAAGLAVYAYDQRGFGQAPETGRWPGEAALQDDLVTLLGLLAARYPGTPLYVLGESMGGAVALTALSRRARDSGGVPPLAGVILVAPAVWSRDEMPWYQDAALWLAVHSVPWLTLSGRGLHIQPSDNIPMLRALGKDPLVIKQTRIDTIKGLCDLMDDASLAAADFDLPALVLIGRKDEVMPALASEAMLARLPPSARPLFFDDGYHLLLRDMHADQPIDEIIAWIRR
jgi:alpha-beta hydrolase superfamily lysophospholipase